MLELIKYNLEISYVRKPQSKIFSLLLKFEFGSMDMLNSKIILSNES